MNKPVIVIAGPTASGKTALACELYDTFPMDLISVDSAQIYRELNIGSAKPNPLFLANYPHALINILDPEESYSAAQFVADVNTLVQKSWDKQRVPVLVGGTMLYYQALFAGLSDLPTSNLEIRTQIEAKIDKFGLAAFYENLKMHDPECAAKISPNDRQRLTRFTELMHVTGKTPTELFTEQKKSTPDWKVFSIGLIPERKTLHQLIEKRFHLMMKAGFVEEVQELRKRPNLSASHNSMRSVGYRQIWEYLEGEHTLAEATELGIIATRQLAKRQVTWMNNGLKTVLPLKIYDPLAANINTQIANQINQWLSHENA